MITLDDVTFGDNGVTTGVVLHNGHGVGTFQVDNYDGLTYTGDKAMHAMREVAHNEMMHETELLRHLLMIELYKRDVIMNTAGKVLFRRMGVRYRPGEYDVIVGSFDKAAKNALDATFGRDNYIVSSQFLKLIK